MADRRGLGPRALGRGGSNPPLPTKASKQGVKAATFVGIFTEDEIEPF